MGIFSSLSEREKEVLEKYASDLVGMGISRGELKEMIIQIREESVKEGTDQLPSNYGDILLRDSEIKADVKARINKKREDGVRDEDIQWWWNMSDTERRLIQKIDQVTRLSVLMQKAQEGYSPAEVMKFVAKFFTMYNEMPPQVDISNFTEGDKKMYYGEDRYLPLELHNRVDLFLRKKQAAGLVEAVKNESGRYSSFNAFVRDKIRNGEM